MKITVEQLIELLKREDPQMEMYFGGLDFYRLKDRGAYVQMEFTQTLGVDEQGNVQVQNH